MNDIITLNTYDITSDGFGGFTKELDESSSVWAKVEEKAPNPLFDANSKDHVRGIKVTIRYFDVILSKSTLTYNGREYIIDSFYHTDKKRFTIINCYE